MKGLFFTFEGIDGAGKSTLMKNIASALEEKGIKVLLTREPGGSQIGEKVRELLLNEYHENLDAKAELLLFLAVRADHLASIIYPALERGEVVLCDRFHDSTVAYQGAGRQLGLDWVINLCQTICPFSTVQKTFYLDIDPLEGLKRVKSSSRDGSLDRIESEEITFHARVREAFLTLAERFPERISTMNAQESPERLAQRAVDTISELIAYSHH